MENLASQQRSFLSYHEPVHSFANFYAEDCAQRSLMQTLKHQLNAKQGCLVQGPDSSGKTHLVHAVCNNMHSALFIDEQSTASLNPCILDNLDNTWLCIDNLHTICLMPRWEKALFAYLTKYTRSSDLPFFATIPSRQSLQRIALPDLRSRLESLLCLNIQVLSAEQQKNALLHSAKRKGLLLKRQHIDWLFNHHPRDNHFLFACLHTLEKVCVQTQQNPSIFTLKLAIKSMHHPLNTKSHTH